MSSKEYFFYKNGHITKKPLLIFDKLYLNWDRFCEHQLKKKTFLPLKPQPETALSLRNLPLSSVFKTATVVYKCLYIEYLSYLDSYLYTPHSIILGEVGLKECSYELHLFVHLLNSQRKYSTHYSIQRCL